MCTATYASRASAANNAPSKFSALELVPWDTPALEVIALVVNVLASMTATVDTGRVVAALRVSRTALEAIGPACFAPLAPRDTGVRLVPCPVKTVAVAQVVDGALHRTLVLARAVTAR